MTDRRQWVGGSDISAIIGVSPWKNAVDLWLDKTQGADDENVNAEDKTQGKIMEPYILDMIRKHHGLEVVAENQRYVDKDVEFFSCEIDAEYDDSTMNIPLNRLFTQNIEIKYVHPFKMKEWGEHGTDELPLHYVAQTQWGLGVTDRDICRVFVLIGKELKPYIVERDNELIAAMREKAYEFWTQYVIPKIQPPMSFDEPADAIETLKRLYPGTNGVVLDATPMQSNWRSVYENAKELRDKYEDVMAGAKAHLLSEMGEAAAIRFDDDRAFVRKLIKKKAYTVNYEATSYIDFRLGKLKEAM